MSDARLSVDADEFSSLTSGKTPSPTFHCNHFRVNLLERSTDYPVAVYWSSFCKVAAPLSVIGLKQGQGKAR